MFSKTKWRENTRTLGKTKLTEFILVFCYIPSTATKNKERIKTISVLIKLYKNTNLILKTAE